MISFHLVQLVNHNPASSAQVSIWTLAHLRIALHMSDFVRTLPIEVRSYLLKGEEVSRTVESLDKWVRTCQ